MTTLRILNVVALLLALAVLLFNAWRVGVARDPLADHLPSMLVAGGYAVVFVSYGFLPAEVVHHVALGGLTVALVGFGAQLWRNRPGRR